MNKKMNAKGITLIALVITIVVLLILAGISINMVLGDNGIVSKANKAKTETEYAEKKEQVSTSIAEAYIDRKGGTITPSDVVINLNNS